MRGLVARLALATAASAVALGAAELASRGLAPGWAPQHAERNFWRYDELLGWAHRPGQRGRLRQPDFDVEVAIGAQGLRDRDYPFERTPGLRRMLVLGDSFAWGFGVEQDEILWEILEARHPDWEIVNSAVSGYGTDQEYLFLRERGLRWRPDVVVLHLHPNDVDDNNAARRYGYPKPRFRLGATGLELGNVPVPALGALERLRRRLLQSSYLYHGLQGMDALLGAHPTGDAREEAGAPVPPLDLAVTRALLAALAALVRQEGARLAVVSNPAEPWLREALADQLASLGVPYGALDEAFRGRARGEVKFARDPHWNAAGHATAARAVEEFLGDAGILH